MHVAVRYTIFGEVRIIMSTESRKTRTDLMKEPGTS